MTEKIYEKSLKNLSERELFDEVKRQINSVRSCFKKEFFFNEFAEWNLHFFRAKIFCEFEAKPKNPFRLVNLMEMKKDGLLRCDNCSFKKCKLYHSHIDSILSFLKERNTKMLSELAKQ